MVSPPETNLEIIEAVDKYIVENYSLDEIKKYKRFTIGFLRESSVTKRVYQDWDQYLAFKQGLIAQTPRFNPDDKILLVRWFNKKESDSGKQYVFFNDYQVKDKDCSNILTIFFKDNNEEKRKEQSCVINN